MKYLKVFETYQEYNSTFTHNNIEYDLNKLFIISENIKVQTFDIEDLKWVLEYTTVEEDRVENADINIPILITYSDSKFVVLDGVHRLKKCIELGKSEIKGKIIQEEILSSIKVEPTQPKNLVIVTYTIQRFCVFIQNFI